MDEEAEVDADEMADEVGAADVEEDEMYYHGGDAAGQVSLTLTLPLPLTLTLTLPLTLPRPLPLTLPLTLTRWASATS